MKVKIILTIILFIFSLLYLNKAITFIQENDTLMQEIKKKEKNYFKEPINAIITLNTMIPGINGQKLNIKESYQKMKKLNSFQESLLVYDTLYPNKSIINNYDKIILQGNPKIKQISLVVIINNEYLLNAINQIIKSNNIQIDLFSNFHYSLKNTNFQSIVYNTYYPFINYCLINNLTINNLCIKNHKYTLLAHNIPSPFLNNTKNNLQNGYILLYHFNEKNYFDLNLIIKYIKNNDYKIVTLQELIKE